MALTILNFDDGKLLWRDLEKRLQKTDATLVLPGNFTRSQFLSQISYSLIGERRVITLLELWDYLGQLAGEETDYLPSELEVAVLREETRSKKHLSLLEDSSLYSLSLHLREIEEESDLDFVPTNSVEEEINELRSNLLTKNINFQGARRSRIARKSQAIDFTRPLIFIHLPETSRQLGGMIRGLSKKNDVFYYPLLAGEVLLDHLRDMNIVDYLIEDKTDRSIGNLFAEKAISASPDRDFSFFSTSDEIDFSLGRALALYQKGEKKIALVSSGGEGSRRKLIQKAQEHGIPLLYRDEIRGQDTLIGSLLLEILEKRDDLLASFEEIAKDAASIYQLDLEDIEAFDAPKENEEELFCALLLLGQKLLEESDAPIKEHLWFASLQKGWEVLQKEGYPLYDAKSFISQTATPRQAYGDGIILLSPGEVTNYKIDHLIFLGLSADDYPKEDRTSSFFSEELLEENPKLLAHDSRFEFLGAVLTPLQSLTLVRDSRKDPSSYYNRLRGFLGVPEEKGESDLARNVLREKARKRLAAHRDIEETLKRLRSEEANDFSKLAAKTTFSVTELEKYLLCPLGWFVDEELKPRAKPNLAQRRGTALHLVLEELLSLPEENRQDALQETLEKHTSFLSPRQQSLDRDSLEKIIEIYASPAWPFREHLLEKSFSIEEDFAGDLIKIRGRIDRIDLRENENGTKEALLIDYKSNKTGLRKNDLQITLYPLMVAKSLELHSLGFLYVSIFQAKHSGSLNNPIEGISSKGVRFDFSTRAGLADAARAIEGIRSGDWFSVGQKCGSWCSHHLLSKTGARI